MVCEASLPDQNMDELNNQNVMSSIADEVIALRESASDGESGANDAAKLGAVINNDDGTTNDDNHKTSTMDDPCSETTSTTHSGDDILPLKTAISASSRDEESGSLITSDVDGSKCNSTAPLIGYATNSTISEHGGNNNDGELQTVPNDTDPLLISPPTTVKSTTVEETEDSMLTSITCPTLSIEEEKDSKHNNIDMQQNTTAVVSPKEAAYMKEKVIEDNGELNERLKKRWERRKQSKLSAAATKRDVPTPTSSSSPRNNSAPQLQQTTIESRSSKSTELYPDDVSFGVEDGEGVAVTSSPTRTKQPYRKCLSDFGPNTSYSSPPRRIGILQADGIVYDDAMLLRLARQSQPGQRRRSPSVTNVETNVDPMTGEELPVVQFNEVKIHVYDLLTKDCLVEMPYLNCNFPLGKCFKAVNDGANYLGTGAYHVGVEVNGVEYAYGGNNIKGMSGVFTCIPQKSPGYDYRETIDLGMLHTTKKTWIRIPNKALSPLSQRVSAALVKLTEEGDEESKGSSEGSQNAYTYREIQTFADGHTVIHEMAKDYMGSDYDLLRKNCCTFAHDACLRLGVNEEDIPSWFRNAALVGAQAEDTYTNVDNTVKNVFKCSEEAVLLETEECSAGFEVIATMGGLGGSNTLTSLKVVETSQGHHFSNDRCAGIPKQVDPEVLMRESASWA